MHVLGATAGGRGEGAEVDGDDGRGEGAEVDFASSATHMFLLLQTPTGFEATVLPSMDPPGPFVITQGLPTMRKKAGQVTFKWDDLHRWP